MLHFKNAVQKRNLKSQAVNAPLEERSLRRQFKISGGIIFGEIERRSRVVVATAERHPPRKDRAARPTVPAAEAAMHAGEGSGNLVTVLQNLFIFRCFTDNPDK